MHYIEILLATPNKLDLNMQISPQSADHGTMISCWLHSTVEARREWTSRRPREGRQAGHVWCASFRYLLENKKQFLEPRRSIEQSKWSSWRKLLISSKVSSNRGLWAANSMSRSICTQRLLKQTSSMRNTRISWVSLPFSACIVKLFNVQFPVHILGIKMWT